MAQLQEQCTNCRLLLRYVRNGIFPRENQLARKIVYRAEQYICVDGILYHLQLPREKKRQQVEELQKQLVVLKSLKKSLLRN